MESENSRVSCSSAGDDQVHGVLSRSPGYNLGRRLHRPRGSSTFPGGIHHPGEDFEHVHATRIFEQLVVVVVVSFNNKYYWYQSESKNSISMTDVDNKYI